MLFTGFTGFTGITGITGITRITEVTGITELTDSLTASNQEMLAHLKIEKNHIFYPFLKFGDNS